MEGIYPKVFQDVYTKLTTTKMMSETRRDIRNAHQHGPAERDGDAAIRDLQRTSDPRDQRHHRERSLLVIVLSSGTQACCRLPPWDDIHIGFMRWNASPRSTGYFYRQVSYDHEPIFAAGDDAFDHQPVSGCFAMLDVAEKMGLDIMSAGVATRLGDGSDGERHDFGEGDDSATCVRR